MNDLLGKVNVRNNETFEGSHAEIEDGPPEPPPTEEETSMKDFFKAVEAIKADMNEIRGHQRNAAELHERGKTIVKTKEVQKHQEAMQVRVGACNALMHKPGARLFSGVHACSYSCSACTHHEGPHSSRAAVPSTFRCERQP